MIQKSLIEPELKRKLKPPFAWIDRGFIFNGFLAALSANENLLYFFLVLVADRDGLSYYSYDKICQLLKMDVDTYIQARNRLIQSKLIAFDGSVFQVLSLPNCQQQQPKELSVKSQQADYQTMASIFKQLGHQ